MPRACGSAGHRERDRDTRYRRIWPQWRFVWSRRREHRMWRCKWAIAIIWQASQLLCSAVRHIIAATNLHPHIRCSGRPTSESAYSADVGWPRSIGCDDVLVYWNIVYCCLRIVKSSLTQHLVYINVFFYVFIVT